MPWLSRLVNLVRAQRLNDDLDDERQFHLTARTEDLVRQGMSPEDAHAQARRQFGNALSLRDSSRDIRIWPRLESILLDVRFGLRLFRKNPTVTAAAVLSLSFGIGACAAAFSLINALMLRPLPVADPQRLVYAVYRSSTDTEDLASFNYPLFVRMRDASRTQIQLFGMSYTTRRDAVFDDAGGQSERVYAQWISGDALSILGVKPVLGRLFTASDDVTPGQHPVAVISHDFWQRRFGGNPAVLGRWLTVREKQLQIVGVTEVGFTGVEPGVMTDVWAPNMMWSDEALSSPAWSWFRVWGRLQPGVRAEQAQAQLQTTFTTFRREHVSGLPADTPTNRVAAYVNTPIRLLSASNGPSALRERFGRALWILGAVAILVLLIAAANVASLLLARTAARGREMALRISIGAGRARLIQQILIESVLLSIASCSLGAIVALTAAHNVVRLLSTSAFTIRLDVSPDWRVLAFLGCLGAAVTLVFGLAPALTASGMSPHEVMSSGGGRQTTRIGMFRPFVAAQVAFSFVVLFIGGLLLTSFSRLIRSDLGFDSSQVVIASVESPELREAGPAALAYWEQLVGRLAALPGVESVSFSGWGLFEGSSSSQSVRVPGRQGDAFEPYYLPTSPGFFETMRMRLLDGRDLEWRDVRSNSAAVVVNESFVKRYFPGESPIGKRFSYVIGNRPPFPQEIVGVVQDAKYLSVREAAQPTVYAPQRSSGWAAVQLRTALEPSLLASLLRDALPEVHPTFRLTDLTLQSTLVDNTLVRERLLALLSGFFVLVATVLVGVGLYGVLSYTVIQRTREIGIRLALGSRGRAVVALVVFQMGVVVAIGLVLGVLGGMASSRLIATLLYEAKPSDVWSVAAPLVVLLATCAAASLVPAWRAVRVDPMTALRCD
jgi:predicted permease